MYQWDAQRPVELGGSVTFKCTLRWCPCAQQDWLLGLPTPNCTLPNLYVCSRSPTLELKGQRDCGISGTDPKMPITWTAGEADTSGGWTSVQSDSVLWEFGKTLQMTLNVKRPVCPSEPGCASPYSISQIGQPGLVPRELGCPSHPALWNLKQEGSEGLLAKAPLLEMGNWGQVQALYTWMSASYKYTLQVTLSQQILKEG